MLKAKDALQKITIADFPTKSDKARKDIHAQLKRVSEMFIEKEIQTVEEIMEQLSNG